MEEKKGLVWHTDKRIVDDLVPFERNPRRLTNKQAKDLKNSLKKFNLVEIPAIDTDNKIIAGHQRLKIMQLVGRGKEEIDVRVPNRKLTKEEFKEYNIRSNKNKGEWDWDMLGNDYDIGELEEWGFSDKDLHLVEILDDISLPDGDKPGFQQMTFTLSDNQADIVKQAVDGAKKDGGAVDTKNENSNGNALALICEKYNGD